MATIEFSNAKNFQHSKIDNCENTDTEVKTVVENWIKRFVTYFTDKWYKESCVAL